MKLKFRAWDKRFNHMIHQLPDGYRLAFNGSIQVIGYDDLSTVRESDEFIVMQFTGLTTESGQAMYLGDIGEFENGDRFVLKAEDWLEVYVDWIGEPNCEDQARDLYRITRAKIIGNIHQHPELMDRGNNND